MLTWRYVVESERRKFFYYRIIKINKLVIGRKRNSEILKKILEEDRSGWKELGNRLIGSEMHSA